ncbi:ankyrin repeat domain-containing protein [Legionella feeleii]|nr:ankyrin repeat domain-containing protein [Legionella feeleii]
MMEFNALYEELGLNSKQSDEERVQILAQWCYEKVSRDIRFTDKPEENYDNYEELATDYLEEFLINIPQDLGKEVDAFEGRNTIQAAAFLGLDQVITSLNPQRDLLNKPDAQGNTPLHIAALAGHFYTVSVLLDLGAAFDNANKQSQLPIFSALVMPMLYEDDLKEKKIRIFRLLREKSPKTLGHQDIGGDTVLQLMAIHDFSTLLAEVLKTNPELALIKNNYFCYPIHTAILNNKTDCVRILIAMKQAATLADSKGRLALHYAARYSNKDITILCCEASKDLNVLDGRGRTAIMLAAQAGNNAALNVLVDKGADVHAIDSEGYSALHYAVLAGHLETVRWLLANTTIDINAPDSKQQTPLALCNTPEKIQIKNLLLERGAI